MRRFLVSAAIIGLIAGSPALAQDREHRDQAAPPHAEQHGPQGGGAPHGAPAAPRPAAQAQPQRGGPPRGQEMRGAQQARPAPNNAPNNAPRDNAMRGDARPGNAPANAMRGNARPGNAPANAMRGPGPNRDFSQARNYHQNFNAARRFHGPAYRPPQGYYARRWTWGMTLPSLFWDRQYWLTDYSIYDLPPPPFGAIWVRVGGDALLIDQYSGSIIEVDYGVFY